MFVERLTKEDVQEFLGYKRVISMELDVDGSGHLRLRLSVEYNHDFTTCVFTDMKGGVNDIKWRQFLYKKFGEEYREWYINQHLKIFE